MRSNARTWAIRGGAVAAVVTLVAASTGVTGTGGISGRAAITQPGTYTVVADFDLTATNLAAGSAAILVALAGGQAVIDLDGHSITRGTSGPVIELVCGPAGGEVVIRDGRLRTGTNGIRSTGCDVRVENVTVAGAGGDGVRISGGALALVSTTIRNTGGNGVTWSDATGHLDVVDSTITRAGAAGLVIRAAGQVTVATSSIQSSTTDGVIMDLTIGGGTSDGATFTDTRIVAAGQDGYRLRGNIPLTISGGGVRQIGGDGISVTGSDQTVTISGATFGGVSGTAAIRLASFGGTTTVADNQIRTCASGVVINHGEQAGAAAQASVTIARNNLTGDGYCEDWTLPYDFRIEVGGAASTRIMANTIEGGAGGMLCNNEVVDGLVVISGNQLRQLTSTGLVISGRGAVIRDNVIAGTGSGVGIRFLPGAELGLVEHNRVRIMGTGVEWLGDTATHEFWLRDNMLVGNTTAFVGVIDAGGNLQ